MIGEVLEANVAQLESKQTFVGSEAIEFPTVLMYTYYLLGYHYLNTKQLDLALEFS